MGRTDPRAGVRTMSEVLTTERLNELKADITEFGER